MFFALWVVVGWMRCHGVTSGSAVRVGILLISSFKIRLIIGVIRSHNEIIINWYFNQSSERKSCLGFFFSGEWVYSLTILTLNQCEMQHFLVRLNPPHGPELGDISRERLWLRCWRRSRFTSPSSSRTGRCCWRRWLTFFDQGSRDSDTIEKTQSTCWFLSFRQSHLCYRLTCT